MDLCAFCDFPVVNDCTILGEKGCQGVLRASIERGINIEVIPGQKVHATCRRFHVNTKRQVNCVKRCRTPDTHPEEPSTRRFMRSDETDFNMKGQCFYCCYPETFDRKSGYGHKLTPCCEIEVHARVMERCRTRNDDWASRVKTRISAIIDLPAADAVYHAICSSNFRTGRGIPICFSNIQHYTPSKSIRTIGRRKNITQDEAFHDTIIDFLDNTEENEGQTTINELSDVMNWYLESSESDAYSFPYMKQKVKEHLGDRCIIGELDGKPNTVTLIDSASKILHDFHLASVSKTNDPEGEKYQIIKTACRLIENDIRCIQQTRDTYPDMNDLDTDDLLNYLPESVTFFIRQLLPKKTTSLKIAALGHALVQISRPRSTIAPLQLGLAVQMHTQFASRFLIDSLNHLGFCVSYSEVQKFERNSAVIRGKDIAQTDLPEGHSINYSADNVDSESITLDGRGQFHGMGIIASVTPGVKNRLIIPRIKITNEDIRAVGTIKILRCPKLKDGLRSVIYKPLPPGIFDDPSSHMETLWKASGKSGWSGIMQMVSKGDHPGKSSVMYLPMIDMSSSDPNCIYTTLHFVADHSKQYNATPVLTFDQPLWWKSLNIIENSEANSPLRQIVLKVGIMHLNMSYFGSIGHSLSCSGIQQLFEIPYAENSVPYILNGKSLERATRVHQLANTALHTLLEEKAVSEGLLTQTDCAAIRYVAEQMIIGNSDHTDDEAMKVITNYQVKIDEICQSLEEFRTSKLWLQYMKQCDIQRKLKKAERTGNWKLHLQAVQESLSTLAATGHSLYTKTARVYLQRMHNLKEEHPKVYEFFMDGHHVVRLSDQYWSGIPTDQAIEQTLMRVIKSNGGLSRGRGWTEMQQLIWIMSRPICADISQLTQDLTQTTFVTSDQHKESSKARLKRDEQDVADMCAYLRERSPFDDDSNLRNIATGLICNQSNADQVFKIGNAILSEMTGMNVVQYTFRKKDRIVNMNSNVMKIEDTSINIDPHILFQRFVVTAMKEEKLPDIFHYELCAYPASIFEAKFVMRVADKPSLADSLWSIIPEEQQLSALPTLNNVKYVIDGGWLMHRIEWTKRETYRNIVQKYINFVIRNYGHATVVFDGYPNTPQTKDAAHIRRKASTRCADTRILPDLEVYSKREDFLSNPTNKQQLINLISNGLIQVGCKVHHAEADADLLIVQTSIKEAVNSSTVLIGNDTDLLILLLYHVSSVPNPIYYQPVTQQCTKKQPRVWQVQNVQHALGPVTCSSLLFIHAVSGCDTTSRVFGVSKGAVVKVLKNEVIQSAVRTFNNQDTSKNEVIRDGESALLKLFGAKKDDTSLDALRLRKFLDKLHKASSFIHPKTLPPTSSAASNHSLRVYHQVQCWIGRELLPCEWGWELQDTSLLPTMSNMIAPEYLAKAIRCSCKTECATRNCSCRKVGLECTIACECSGDCLNCNIQKESVEEDASDN